jgi:hypothetical protein
MLGVDGKARLNAQMQRRPVLEAEHKGVAVSVGSEQLQGSDSLARDLAKTDKTPALELPDGGFFPSCRVTDKGRLLLNDFLVFGFLLRLEGVISAPRFRVYPKSLGA